MAPEIAKITPVEEVKGTLVKMQEQFALALPKHIPPERFVAIAQLAIINMPTLTQCDRNSLYNAFVQCAQDGLYPDNREAAIIPFAGKAKYMPMVAGVCKKVRNSGEISVVDAQVVYANDQYDYWVDEKGPHFKHIPARGERGEPILTYAYAIGKDGGVYFEEIDEEQMAEIEKVALIKLPLEKQKNSPWNGPFKSEMKRKSALRRLGKYRLPSSADMDMLFKRDDDFDDPDHPLENPPEPKTTSSRLNKIVETQATVVEETPGKPTPTVQKAVAMAKEVFPGAKEIKSSLVAPKTNPPQKPGTTIFGATVNGKIEDMKVQDGVGRNGPWRRFACKISDKFYGTFDTKIGEQMAPAMDAHAEVKLIFNERTTSDNEIFRDIVSIEVLNNAAEEAAPVAEAEIPI